jgi:FkbM family methyltransferase
MYSFNLNPSDLVALLRRRRQFRLIDSATDADVALRRIEPELRLLRNYLDPACAFLDVGANVGTYTYVASKHIPRSRIFAFEPQAYYVKRLHGLFPGVHVEQVALSSHEGEATFAVPKIGGIPYQSRGTLEKIEEPGQDGTTEQRVRLATLDGMKTALGMGKVGCIKIDVEGHEIEVLKGAQMTISEDHPAIIIEIEQRHHDMPIETIFEWFFARGYQGEFYDNEAHMLRPIKEFSTEAFQKIEALKTSRYINNFIFTCHE